MGDNLFTTFNSAANANETLEILWAKDGDLHLTTYRADCSYNANIRLRAYHGGGNNTLLRTILNGLVLKDWDFREPDFLGRMFVLDIPNDYREFSFSCDDNPGSHLKIAIAENMFGIQTNCHDEERDLQAGGFGSMQGDGAMVWIPKDLAPRVYAQLKDCLIDGHNPNPMLYERPFKFLTLEAHA